MNTQVKDCYSRYNEVKKTFTENEAARRIEEVYQANFNPSSGLDAWDQLLACEAVAESTPVTDGYIQTNKGTNENANVNGNDNDARKHTANFGLTPNKLELIGRLKKFNYKTPPIEIEECLKLFFDDPGTYPDHWLYLAQHYTPKSISAVLAEITKQGRTGFETIQSPAKYFTKLLKRFHPLRKRFRSTIGARKRQGGQYDA